MEFDVIGQLPAMLAGGGALVAKMIAPLALALGMLTVSAIGAILIRLFNASKETKGGE